jgi:ElaB/YqjD/DUF883 family membrane-anchored ribosome-binding protein
MADISDLQQQQALIRAEADQLKAELWPRLHDHGEEWVDRLDQMLQAFMQHDEDPWNTLGTLAQIGFLTMLAEWNSGFFESKTCNSDGTG